MELKNKRVLVTGGSSGIGLALAHALIARGARVVITGRRRSVLDDALRSLDSATGVCADVGSPEGRAATLDQAIQTLGGLDILVNNAGGVRAGRLENTTEADIEQMVIVDLLAPVLLTRAALPALRASGDAMVVNVASCIALVGAPFYATYAAVKAGLARFGGKRLAIPPRQTASIHILSSLAHRRFRMRRAPLSTTSAMTVPITKSGYEDPVHATSAPATITPALAITSFAEKI